MPRPRELGVFIDTENDFHRAIVRGVARHALPRGHRLHLGGRPTAPDGMPSGALAAAAERFDAMIVQGGTSAELGRLLAGMGPPAVAVTWRPPGFAGPVIELDNHAIGGAAAAHLLARGLRRLAFAGWIDAPVAVQRWEGFVAACAGAGVDAARFPLNSRSHPRPWTAELPGWLRARGLPAGLAMQDDITAHTALQACLAGGLRVPDDIAVVGVDDDPVLCETVDPPLSSVRVPGIGLGFAAGEAVERLLAGAAPRPTAERLQPLGVATRRSSDVLASADPAVAAALAFIHARWVQDIDGEAVARAAGLSRRALERRFAAQVGAPPMAEVRRLRIEHAQRLLAETDQPLADVARNSGFSSDQRLCAVFRTVVGLSPGAFRARARR